MADDATIAKVSPKKHRQPSQKANRTKLSKAKELANSRPLCVHRWSDYPEADRAVELVVERIRAQGHVKRVQQQHKVVLKVVILDLYAAWVHDPSRYLGYSRDAGYYKAASQYNSLGIGYCRLIYVIDALQDLKYITSAPGCKNRTTGYGRRTRMRATKKLINLMVNDAGLKPEMIARDHNEEVIILRNTDKKDVEYPETPDTEDLRAHARTINQFLSSHMLNLHISDKQIVNLAKRLVRNDKHPIDFTRTRLRRIFNNESFDQGGRFYGGWWQEIPSEYRKFIEISGKRTIEIDYSGFHPRLLYAQEGIDYTSDPYGMPVTGIPAHETRGVVKVAFNILLNASTEAKAVHAIRKEYPQYSKTVKEIIAAIKRTHQRIAHHLHSGVGLELQRLDSDILQNIMLMMAREYGVLVLPVHDSFIVRTGYDDEMRDAMEQCYKRAFPNSSVQPILRDSKVAEGDGEATIETALDHMVTHKGYWDREAWLRKRAQAAAQR